MNKAIDITKSFLENHSYFYHHYYAAETLNEKIKISANKKDEIYLGLSRDFLYCLSFELLLKYLLKKNNSFDDDDETHKILELYKKLRVKINVPTVDDGFLKKIENIVTCFGRYPLPKNDKKKEETIKNIFENHNQAKASGEIAIFDISEVNKIREIFKNLFVFLK